MAFPSIAGTGATTAGSTAATNKACVLPASIAAGNLLILVIRSAGADTHTTPTDWNDLVKNDGTDASDDVVSIFYRVATGSEGTSVTVNGTGSVRWAAISWRITDHNSAQAPQASTVASGTNTTPNPTTCTPTGGAKDYLWLWVGTWEGEQTSPPTGNPTNYSNTLGSDTGTAGAVTANCRVGVASRTNNASSEDAGSWTISASDDWMAWVIAVHPITAHTMPVGSGTYSLTGTGAKLCRGYPLAVGSGSISLTGSDVALTYGQPSGTPAAWYWKRVRYVNRYGISGRRSRSWSVGTIRRHPIYRPATGAGPVTLDVGAGSYTLTGTAVGLRRGYPISVESGSYTLTGSAVGLAHGYPMVVGAGTYSLTGADVTLRFGHVVPVESGSYSLSGTAVSLKRGYPIAGDAGTYSLTGSAVALRHDSNVAAGSGSYTLNGTAVALQYSGAGDKTIIVGSGTYVLTGTAVALRHASNVAAGAGTYALTGSAVSLTHQSYLGIGSGSYALSGTDVNLRYGRSFAVGSGSYLLTGSAVGLFHQSRLVVESGTYTLTGSAVVLRRGLSLPVGPGSYSVVGTAVGLTHQSKLVVGSGTYTLTGSAVGLIYSGAGDKTIIVGSGSYALTGTAVSLRHASNVAAGSGSYSLSGSAVALRRGYPLVVGAGAYSLTGSAAALRAARRISGDSGVYVLTGTAVGLRRGYPLAAGSGSYVLTGAAATLRHGFALPAGSGSYSLVGSPVGLRKSQTMAAGVGTYSLTGSAVALWLRHAIAVGSGTYTFSGTAVGLVYVPFDTDLLDGGDFWTAPYFLVRRIYWTDLQIRRVFTTTGYRIFKWIEHNMNPLKGETLYLTLGENKTFGIDFTPEGAVRDGGVLSAPAVTITYHPTQVGTPTKPGVSGTEVVPDGTTFYDSDGKKIRGGKGVRVRLDADSGAQAGKYVVTCEVTVTALGGQLDLLKGGGVLVVD